MDQHCLSPYLSLFLARFRFLSHSLCLSFFHSFSLPLSIYTVVRFYVYIYIYIYIYIYVTQPQWVNVRKAISQLFIDHFWNLDVPTQIRHFVLINNSAVSIQRQPKPSVILKLKNISWYNRANIRQPNISDITNIVLIVRGSKYWSHSQPFSWGPSGWKMYMTSVRYYVTTAVRLMKPTAVGFISLTTVMTTSWHRNALPHYWPFMRGIQRWYETLYMALIWHHHNESYHLVKCQ